MSKVLIDRELAERVCHVDNSTRQTARRELRTILAAPSGTPAMPVKAYYHEAPNEYGGLNKSVGLEVRKEFPDAPLVLESDAMARIACLEGEIAKRDARIMGLESQYQRDVYGLNNEGDPIGGEPAGGYANDNARLRAELAALKAQEPVAWVGAIEGGVPLLMVEPQNWKATPLYAAPVSEAEAQGDAWAPSVNDYDHSIHSNPDAKEWADFFVATFPGLADKHDLMIGWFANAMMAMHDHLARKAQGVVIPPSPYMPGSQPTDFTDYELGEIHGRIAMWEEVKRLNAAPAAPAADAGIVDMYRHLQKVTPYRFKKIQDASITDGGDVMYFHKDRFDAALLADMAANCAKESK